MGAYCVDRVHNLLPWQYWDFGSILCRLGTQYATLAVSRLWEHIVLGRVRNMLLWQYFDNESILCM